MLHSVMMDASPEFFDSLTKFLEFLIARYGNWGTVGIGAALLLVGILWRLYNDYRKDKETNAVVAEKDRTIQRLAEQERNYRILFLKEKAGWTDEQIRLFVMKNDFENGVTARRMLEGDKPKTEGREKTTKKTKGSAR